jgi:hypothetical protein
MNSGKPPLDSPDWIPSTALRTAQIDLGATTVADPVVVPLARRP